MDGKAVLETQEHGQVVKKRITEDQLLGQKAYFEEMIARGQRGLGIVQGQLKTIKNDRTKAQ